MLHETQHTSNTNDNNSNNTQVNTSAAAVDAVVTVAGHNDKTIAC